MTCAPMNHLLFSACDGTSLLCFQKSEPISRYLQGDVPLEVKQRIARMGVDTLLKMVRSPAGVI